jgi:uncharacterized protein
MSKLTKYLLIAFGISTLGGAILYFTGLMQQGQLTIGGMILTALLIMPAPAYATLIVEGFDFKAVAENYGVRISKAIVLQTLKISFVFTLSIMVSLLVVSYFVSIFNYDLSHLVNDEGLNKAINSTLKVVSLKIGIKANTANLTVMGGLALAFFGALFAGFSINGLFAFGEELGWRGLMEKELAHHSFLTKNLIIGIFWGLWHSPLILQGYNYPDTPFLGCFFMAILCIAMSFTFSYARHHTDSVLTAAVLHGNFNAAAPLFVFLISSSNMLLGGVVGIVGVFAILLSFMIVKTVFK